MKTIFNKTTLYALLAAGLLAGCINDDDYKTPTLACEETSLVKNMEPQAVTATAVATQYKGDGIIEAYVTSSDLGGNFFKSISFQTLDGSYGFSVPVDVASYASKFEPGRKVLIKLDGTFVDFIYGSTRIGASFEGAVGRLTAADYAKVLNRSCTVVNEEELVQKISIADALNDKRVNTLIELQNVQFATDAVGKPYYDVTNAIGGATNRYIEDASGKRIIFRTSSFATYAGSVAPKGSGVVRGVLTKFRDDYQFVARYESDIKLDKPRIGEEAGENPGGETPGGETPGQGANAALLFAGSDFENSAAFNAGINASFGIKPYATISAGTGYDGTASLKINTAGSENNDYVFNSKPSAALPSTYSKVTFYVKGTAAKSLSINLYKTDGTFYAFNLGTVSTNTTLAVAENNQYTGTIDTGGKWILVTLDLKGITNLNVSNTSADIFALKIGKTAAYDIHLDNFKIE